MFNTARRLLFAALFAGLAGPVFAADLAEPQVVEQAPPQAVYEQPADVGGWYIRGDLDYHKSDVRGVDYSVYNIDPCNCVPFSVGSKSFDFADLKGGFSLGGGVGYKITDHFRTDLTADYWFKSSFSGGTTDTSTTPFTTSAESSKMSALLLLANAYVDIGTYHGITPYIGAGIGGAHVKWDNVYDPTPGATERNPGASSWRFAYALMAGASYCLTDKVILDAGYRFSHIQGGRMFEWDASSSGPGYDRGINTHEVRGGLRYQFGGNNGCSAPVVAYQPEPEPIYTK